MHSLARILLVLSCLSAASLAVGKQQPAYRLAKARPPLITLMYLVNRPDSISSFRQHARQISIIAPQCFSMDAEGFVAGEVPPEVLEIAREQHVALMPLVVNRGFSQELMHTVLDSPAPRARVIRYLLYYALRDGYIGFQFDYENIRYTYRDKFTRFFEDAAMEFHRHGLLLTAAVVGKYADDRNRASPGGFDNWSGVYDYHALGRRADFLSIMAYPQHAAFSDPGPLAGVPWVQQIAEFAVQHVPRKKISLGVPLYGVQWTALKQELQSGPAASAQDNGGTPAKKWKAHGVGFEVVAPVIAVNPPLWDEGEQAHHVSFVQDNSENELWYEDARSLSPKLKLASAENFTGISGWVLGREDPQFWNLVSRNYRIRHPRSKQLTGDFDLRARAAARKLRSSQGKRSHAP